MPFEQRLIAIDLLEVRDASATLLPSVADDAVHVAGYFADVSGNRRVNASDAARVARIAALLDNGFDATPLTDPVIVGDISGNGRVNASDASLIARFAALLPVPEIPPIPAGLARAVGGFFAPALVSDAGFEFAQPSIRMPRVVGAQPPAEAPREAVDFVLADWPEVSLDMRAAEDVWQSAVLTSEEAEEAGVKRGYLFFSRRLAAKTASEST